jgi:hypothetical protein
VIEKSAEHPQGYHLSILGPALPNGVSFRAVQEALGQGVIDYLDGLVDPKTHRWEVILIAGNNHTRLAITLIDRVASKPVARPRESWCWGWGC